MTSEHFQYQTKLPAGFRFRPNDEELMTDYLGNKVLNRPVPSRAVKNIDANMFYNKSPDTIEKLLRKEDESCDRDEGEWYFFMMNKKHEEDSVLVSENAQKGVRWVGNGIGYWKSIGKEDRIFDANGELWGFKVHFTYYESSNKKTHWMMFEYHLSNVNQKVDEWVLIKMKNGRDYTYSD